MLQMRLYAGNSFSRQGLIDVIISSSWGILLAQHQCVRAVDSELTRYGVDHFIPMEERLSIVKGRHVRNLFPMLGDYIPIAISSIWKELQSIRGVRGILLNENKLPAQVTIGEMERMHAMCDDAGVYHSSFADDSGFEYGQRVTPRANDNPFAFHVGKYESKNKRGDLTALFILFGREQKVTFKSGDLLAL